MGEQDATMVATDTLERCVTQAARSVVEDADGTLRFTAVAVDRQQKANSRGFMFDWKRKGDVDLSRVKTNGVLLYRHDDMTLPIGKAERWRVEGDAVLVDCMVPSYANKPGLERWEQFLAPIRQLVKDGILKAVSIGFYIQESHESADVKFRDPYGEEHAAVVITRFLPVELSLCPIGAHDTALIQVPPGMPEPPEDLAAPPDGMRWAPLQDSKLYRLELAAAAEPSEPVEQPYPNEHACRLNEPGKYAKMRRVNGAREHKGKKYDVIFGIKADGTTEEQAYRYPKETWDADDARAHCSAHQGKFEAASKQDESVWRAVPGGLHALAELMPETVPWDAADEMRSALAASSNAARRICALEEMLPGSGSSARYRLPHHRADTGALVWRGLAQAMAVLLGARGGVQGAGAEALRGAYAHLANEYRAFDRVPPEFKTDYTTEDLQAFHEAGMVVIPGMPESEVFVSELRPAEQAGDEAVPTAAEVVQTEPAPEQEPPAPTVAPAAEPGGDVVEALRARVRAALESDPDLAVIRAAVTQLRINQIRETNERNRKG